MLRFQFVIVLLKSKTLQVREKTQRKKIIIITEAGDKNKEEGKAVFNPKPMDVEFHKELERGETRSKENGNRYNVFFALRQTRENKHTEDWRTETRKRYG